MSNSKHSPTPWRLSTQDVCVAFDRTDEIVFDTYGGEHPKEVEQANAAFIIRAVNSHDQLVALLKAADNKLHAMHHYHSGDAAAAIHGLREKIATALAAAEA